VRRYYSRTATLYGSLVQLQRVHGEGAGAAGTGPGRTALLGAAGGAIGTPAGQAVQEFNPLNVLPVAPRFQYLPISAPTHTLTSAAGGAAKGRLSAANLVHLSGKRGFGKQASQGKPLLT
jgi:hypothetical protein